MDGTATPVFEQDPRGRKFPNSSGGIRLLLSPWWWIRTLLLLTGVVSSKRHRNPQEPQKVHGRNITGCGEVGWTADRGRYAGAVLQIYKEGSISADWCQDSAIYTSHAQWQDVTDSEALIRTQSVTYPLIIFYFKNLERWMILFQVLCG